MGRKLTTLRDCIAFWIFGLSNNFAYVIMLSAAEDIMAKQSGGGHHAADPNTTVCQEEVSHACTIGSLGGVLLADIIPSLIIKATFPFFMHRLPFGLRHVTVCMLQAASYLIVAFSTSVPMSLMGVCFAAAGSGLGEITYLSLASHYSGNSISAWSSGTGGAGIFGALAYASLTEPYLLNLSPTHTLLVMLIVPTLFLVTYFFLLTPSESVYRAEILKPSTWIVPKWDRTASSEAIDDGNVKAIESTKWRKSESDVSRSTDSESGGDSGKLSKHIDQLTLVEKFQLAIPMLKYMIPLAIVYYAEYLINQGLTAFLVFDCTHGFWLSPSSQYRWYQVLYQLGVFVSRSSVNCIQLSYPVLVLLPILQSLNAIFFFLNSMYFFVPHIGIVFGLILIEGFYGGGAYVNTFYRIHKDVNPDVKEFSLGIASMADSMGIVISGLSSIPIHNFICQRNRQLY